MVTRNSGLKMVLAATVAMTLTAAMGHAQAPAGGHFQRADFPRHGGPGMGAGFGGGAGLERGFVNPITGAPYSATVTHTHSQSLSGGVTISHSQTVSVARDSQGRTRVETTITPKSRPGETAAEKAMKPNSGPRKIVVVYDPVAGTITRWSDSSKTAMVMPMHRPGGGMRGGRPGMGGSGMRGNGGPAEARGPRGHFGGGEMAHGEVAKSDLGSKDVGGVSALGERETRTIAAGTVGNDKPIVSTHERWVSPDLKIVLSESDNDPLRGKNSVQVANLTRSEPAADLFKAPADYTLHEMGAPGARGGFGQRGPGGPAGQGRPGGGFAPGSQGRPNGWQGGRNRPTPPPAAAPAAPVQN
jgi:hypothetical protein